MDYLDFEFTNNQAVVQANVQIDGNVVTMMVPKSCCFAHTQGICDKISGLGCKDALVNALVQNSTVIGVLGVSVMFINVSVFCFYCFQLKIAM